MNVHNFLLGTLLISLFALLICIPNAYSQDNVFPEDAWGAYSWTQFTSIDKNNAPLVKGGPIIIRWANLEPQNGVYAFDTEIEAKLTKALNNDFYVFLKIYFAGPAASGFTPEWIYSNGVPQVSTDRGVFPYYFDEDYKVFYYRMIAKFGEYILGLPDNLKDRILFIQCTEGSTGDGYCYKGTPPPQYDITREEWVPFRLEAWKKFKAAFSENDVLQFPLLTNDDANTPELRDWMLTELPMAIGVKNGMFTHGYQISDAQERLANHFYLKEQAEAAGKVFFARGEMDAEMNEKGWITQNKKQGLYWSGIYATHCGTTMWNIIQEAVKGYEYEDAINFFNKYAGQLNPETAKGAFCAFYRGLDASDVITFPVNPYGIAQKSNTTRYINICNAFSQYGAHMADAAAATGGGMVNRGATGYNDAGWQILKENFQRHISQIDPEGTSVAWWQIDESVYGRFARGFEHASNKDTIYLQLDDDFFSSAAGTVTMSVIYYDKNPGSTWELKYDAGAGNFKTAFAVTCAGTRTWLKRSIVLTDAEMLNNGPDGSDFALVNTDTLDDVFHLIELERGGTPQDPPGQSSNPNPPNDAADVALNMVLSWTAGTGATEHGIYFGTDSLPGSGTFKGIQSGDTFKPDTLQLSTNYYWRVDGYNSGGTTKGQVWKFTTESSPLAAPDNLAATPGSKNQIDLSWSDNSENETGFSIERTGDGSTNWAEIASVAENVTVYSDSLLDPSTTYFYRVRAVKLYGYSDYSNIASATTMDDPVPPSAPDSLVARGVLGNQINLTWLDRSINEDWFYIERSDDGVSGWTLVDSVNKNITKFSDMGLDAQTTYYYRVQASNVYGVSAYSNIDSAMTLIENGIITYLSELPFNEIANGWGPVEIDSSNGPAQLHDGHIITINGVTYDKGIGCHAYSELVWYLGGKAISFMSDIGLDDEMTGGGSIVFEVYLDDVLAFQSDVMTYLDDAVTVGLDVSGVDSLKLIVTDGGDDKGKDHADWADARVISTEPLAISEKLDLSQPTEFNLYQNYPNPFNPTTNITFTLKIASEVKLTVYNTLGQEVKSLVNERIRSGAHTVQWDGKNESGQIAAAGVYFYRIRAAEKKTRVDRDEENDIIEIT